MKSAKDWLDESIALYDVGHDQQALAACDVAINLAPNLAFAYYVKGRILGKLKNADAKAIAVLNHALKLEPGVTVPYYELAEIYERQGNNRLAQAYREKVRQLGYHEYQNRG